MQAVIETCRRKRSVSALDPPVLRPTTFLQRSSSSSCVRRIRIGNVSFSNGKYRFLAVSVSCWQGRSVPGWNSRVPQSTIFSDGSSGFSSVRAIIYWNVSFRNRRNPLQAGTVSCVPEPSIPGRNSRITQNIAVSDSSSGFNAVSKIFSGL